VRDSAATRKEENVRSVRSVRIVRIVLAGRRPSKRSTRDEQGSLQPQPGAAGSGHPARTAGGVSELFEEGSAHVGGGVQSDAVDAVGLDHVLDPAD